MVKKPRTTKESQEIVKRHMLCHPAKANLCQSPLEISFSALRVHFSANQVLAQMLVILFIGGITVDYNRWNGALNDRKCQKVLEKSYVKLAELAPPAPTQSVIFYVYTVDAK
ncbi:hypothetical protein DdX_17870 [Ditylenchus destructor]|uniref:Uncharacterized protein n=1 Tax=Ditylenchus destructor TaxID=166010 RepID=A0AAD4QVE8_9BILA|nr:hypothetical protein DdX_17870 [Ditylenchus destructor]